tara:strand:- start:927 stop:1625 length:699 start_codon:yes stop_codon:yes gene_type:complete
MEEAVSWILASAKGSDTKTVHTVNPEFIVQAQRNTKFQSVLRNGDLNVADGVGIIGASILLGSKLPERITGVDLIQEIAKASSGNWPSMYFLGAERGIAERAATNLLQIYPQATIAGYLSVDADSRMDQKTVSKINLADPDILLVAFGAPTQELWIARNKAQLNASICIGVGGSFDYLSGHVKRAPVVLRKLGLEWGFRLYKQPKRWKRMLALPKFVSLVLRQSMFHNAKNR